MSKSLSAEIIAIGTELLLGDIVDTNSAHIARKMRGLGIDLFRTTAVGDNRGRIVNAIQHARQRADILLMTGGLGPTVDDVTREAIAEAFDVELEFRDELWQSIRKRFATFGIKPTENNRRQAYLPQGSRPLTNPVGTAPGLLIERGGFLLAALPGVPGEMERMLADQVIPVLHALVGPGDVIQSLHLRTAGVGESWIDEQISDLEQGSNPTVGLAAHSGRVDIRITSKAKSLQQAARMNGQMAALIRSRIGEHIYTEGNQSLEGVLRDRLHELGGRLITVECGTRAALAEAFSDLGPVFVRGTVLPPDSGWEELLEVESGRERRPEDLLIICQLRSTGGELTLRAELSHGGESQVLQPAFRGELARPARWAVSIVLSAGLKMLVRSGGESQSTSS